jgi:hypothetical protein
LCARFGCEPPSVDKTEYRYSVRRGARYSFWCSVRIALLLLVFGADLLLLLFISPKRRRSDLTDFPIVPMRRELPKRGDDFFAADVKEDSYA